MEKRSHENRYTACGAQTRREMLPLSESQCLAGREMEEFEQRLEAQNVLLEPAIVWLCSPVNVCGNDCGDGYLCHMYCPCDVLT